MNPGQKRVKWYESIILISRKNFDSFWEDIFRKLFHMFFLPDFGPSIDSKCNFFFTSGFLSKEARFTFILNIKVIPNNEKKPSFYDRDFACFEKQILPNESDLNCSK